MDPDLQYQQTPFVSAPNEGYNEYSAGHKKRLLPLIVLAVLIVLGLAVFGVMKFMGSSEAASDQPMAEVQISPDGFRPVTVKIKKGQDVMWTNSEEQPHQVYADQTQVPGLDSQEPLAQGDAYIYTFDKSGTINYYDPLNPTVFKGTIVVE